MAPSLGNIPIAAEIPEIIQTLSSLPRSDVETPIEFKIPARQGMIIPPRSLRLQYRMKVQKRVNGELMDIDTENMHDNICLVNFAGMANFKQVEIFQNGDLITRNSYNHGLNAYLRAEEEYTKLEKELILSLAGWEPDVGADVVNAKRQAALFRNNGVMDFTTPLVVDCLMHDTPFPDDVDLHFRFHRAPVPWVINGTPLDGVTYEITFIKANMLITRLQLTPGTDIYRIYGGTITAQYIRNEYRHFVLPPHITTINEEIFNGIQPFKLTIFFINQDGYNGSYDHNPFYFEHHLIKRVNLKRDEMHSLPPAPYEFELDTSRAYERVRRAAPATMAKGGKAKRSLEDHNYAATKGAEGQQATGDAGAAAAVPAVAARRPIIENIDEWKGVLPVLCNYQRAYLAMMDARGNHFNTRMTYESWTQDGKFQLPWDLRADRDEDPGQYVQQPKCSMRIQSEHHREIVLSIVMLTRGQHLALQTTKKGGVTGHV
jgi:hypothetical protein